MLIQKIQNYILPMMPAQIRQEGGEKLAEALSFFTVALVSIPLFPIFGITYELMGHTEIAIWCWLAVIISVSSVPALFITKNPTIANHILTFGAFSVLVFGSFHAGGIDAPGVYWFSAAQLLSILMFRGKSEYFWSILFSLAAIVLAFPNSFGLHHDNVIKPDEMVILKLNSIFGSALLMIFVANSYKKYQSDLQASTVQNQNEMLHALEENSKLVRLLSHDISNSLVLLQAGVRSLKSKDFEQLELKMKPHLDRIERGSKNIKNLVAHVKEQQALISGKKELNLGPVDLYHLIEEVVHMLEPQWMKKDLKIEFRPDFSNGSTIKDFTVFGESVSCSNVILANLLSNAIKFSPKGEKIGIDLYTEDDSVVVKFTDRGVGIPQSILAVLFEFGAKTSRTGTEGEEGTGFGMPLVQTYMKKFGGSISVSSKVADEKSKDSGTSMKLVFKKHSTRLGNQLAS